jgi:AcrR family transcriptional regulator
LERRDKTLGNRNTREILLQTSINLFYQKGCLDTSIREIGDKAGISTSIIYHYFKNKEELLFEIIHNSAEELLQALREIEKKISDPLECLREMVTEHAVLFCLKRKKETKIVDSDRYLLHGKRHEMIVGQQREIYNLYKKKLEELIYKGLLRDIDPTVATFSILGIINSSFRWYREGGRLSREEVAQNILKFVFHGTLNLQK